MSPDKYSSALSKKTKINNKRTNKMRWGEFKELIKKGLGKWAGGIFLG